MSSSAGSINCALWVGHTSKQHSLPSTASVADVFAAGGMKDVGASHHVFFVDGVPAAAGKLLSEFSKAPTNFRLGKTGITMAEVNKHNSEKHCWMLLNAGRVFNNKELGKGTWVVYDVSEYLDDHPGGKDIMLRNSGKDGTKEYLNVGHSASAHKILTRYPIGTMADADVEELEKGAAAAASSDGSSMLPYVLALLALLAALAYQFYFKKQ